MQHPIWYWLNCVWCEDVLLVLVLVVVMIILVKTYCYTPTTYTHYMTHSLKKNTTYTRIYAYIHTFIHRTYTS